MREGGVGEADCEAASRVQGVRVKVRDRYIGRKRWVGDRAVRASPSSD